MHLVYPSKFCVAIIFDFSCDDCNTQEQEVLARSNWKQRVCKILESKQVLYVKNGEWIKSVWEFIVSSIKWFKNRRKQ